MIGPLAVADLHDAQAVAGRDQPHGFGVDGDRAGGKDAMGQILFMEMDGHDSPLWPKPPVRNRPLATGNERRPFRPNIAIFTPFTRLNNHSPLHSEELPDGKKRVRTSS